MLRKGEKISDYTLIKRLGQGGFGEVWQAEKRTELSTNEFAIKFFVPKDESKIDREKIRKEIETWKKVSGYSHIISVIEADIFEQYVYVVSELAEGGALDKYIIRHGGQAKNQAEAVKITTDILVGLEQMHGEGFVHRDLKPANILIKKGLHCLADFGISREMKTNSKATGTSGTFEFMPPEAFDTKPSVTVHTDIWSVGIIFHLLLTGKLPYPQEMPSLVTAVLFDPPELDKANLLSDFRAIIETALQKKREDRFQTANEMRVELEKAWKKAQRLRETIDDEGFDEMQKAEAEKAELARKLAEAKRQSEKLQQELEAEKQKQAEIERQKRAKIEADEIIRLERERIERETAAEKERQRLADEDRLHRQKLEETNREEQKRAELLLRLKLAKEKGRKFGLLFWGESNLTEDRLQEFEDKIAQAEQTAQETKQKEQAELWQRVKKIEPNAIRLGVAQRVPTLLTEQFVNDYEKRVAVAEKMREAEAQRQREETERKRREAEQNEPLPQPFVTKQVENKTNFLPWIVGGIVSLLLFVVLPVGMIVYYNKPTPSTTTANKPTANTTTNKLTTNTATNTASNMSKTSGNPQTFKNSIGMEFVKIPSGSFMMGSPTSEKDRWDNESPQHKVTINYEFYLGKYEVTQEEYEKVMGTNPSSFKNCPRCPVEQVSWNDAQEFIKKLNAKKDGYEYRLPSEAEWEYAARGGKEGKVFGVGDGNNLSSEEANFDGNYPYGNASKGKYLAKTVNVGSYKPNDFGLYDMHGNVWEWVADIYNKDYNGLSVGGSANMSVGDSSLRVLRGGSWNNDGLVCRSAFRFWVAPDFRYYDLGFRVAVRPR
jgi:formylglycine-generating enzyme required for sulfatase activity